MFHGLGGENAQVLSNRVRELWLQAESTEKARVLWFGMSRGHALLKQAVEWDQPRIGGREQPNQLDGVRGSLWRYVMAFSGWERAGRAVLWDGTQQRSFQQRFLAPLFDAATDLTPPWSDRDQVPANLKQWLASSLDETHPLLTNVIPNSLCTWDNARRYVCGWDYENTLTEYYYWRSGEYHWDKQWIVKIDGVAPTLSDPIMVKYTCPAGITDCTLGSKVVLN